jgi:hypothetical protein
MSNESVCQVAHSWVDVGGFHTRLFGVVCVTCGDFHNGSEKRPVSHFRPHPAVSDEIQNVIPTHRTPLIWHPVTSSYFQK